MPKRGQRRLFVQLCCVFLLLFAQQAALTHAVWHAHQQLSTEEHARLDAGAVHDGGAMASTACAFDVVLGEVLGGAPCYGPPKIVSSGADEVTRRPRHSSVTVEFLAPLSRGPPALPMT